MSQKQKRVTAFYVKQIRMVTKTNSNKQEVWIVNRKFFMNTVHFVDGVWLLLSISFDSVLLIDTISLWSAAVDAAILRKSKLELKVFLSISLAGSFSSCANFRPLFISELEKFFFSLNNEFWRGKSAWNWSIWRGRCVAKIQKIRLKMRF